MKGLKRIHWHIVDQILAVTDSKPMQLLEWLSNKRVMGYEQPCSWGCSYNNYYWFLTVDDYDDCFEPVAEVTIRGDDFDELLIPDIGKDFSITDFWSRWRHEEDFRVAMTAQFKRRYKL